MLTRNIRKKIQKKKKKIKFNKKSESMVKGNQQPNLKEICVRYRDNCDTDELATNEFRFHDLCWHSQAELSNCAISCERLAVERNELKFGLVHGPRNFIICRVPLGSDNLGSVWSQSFRALCKISDIKIKWKIMYALPIRYKTYHAECNEA